jgi:hypothetical protein
MVAGSKLPERETNSLFLFGARVKNAWRPVYIPPFFSWRVPKSSTGVTPYLLQHTFSTLNLPVNAV